MKRINLIPPQFSTGKKAFVQSGLARQAIAAGGVVLFVLLVHYLFNWFSLAGLKGTVNSLNQKLSQGQTVSESVGHSKETLQAQLDNLDKKLANLVEKRNRLMDLQKHRFEWSSVLSDFHNAIPDQVWIDELVLDEPQSKVKGGTFGNPQVKTFLDNINKSHYFSNASFSRTETGTLNKQPVVRFELTFELVKK